MFDNVMSADSTVKSSMQIEEKKKQNVSILPAHTSSFMHAHPVEYIIPSEHTLILQDVKFSYSPVFKKKSKI